jgi:uncharacterized protein YkwD
MYRTSCIMLGFALIVVVPLSAQSPEASPSTASPSPGSKETKIVPAIDTSKPETITLPTQVALGAQEKALLELVNKARAKKGVSAVTLSPALVQAARDNSKEMARLAAVHTEVGQEQVIRTVAKVYRPTGTGLVAGEISPNPPALRTWKVTAWTEGYYPLQGIIDTWMSVEHSPKSHENLVKPQAKQVGIGVFRTSRNEFYYTVLLVDR